MHRALGQQCDAQPGLRRGAQHDKVMADESWSDLDAHAAALPIEKLPALVLGLWREAERFPLGQLLGPLEPARLIEIRATRHQELAELSEAAHDETILTARLRAHPHGGVEPLVDDIDAPVGGVQLDPDCR